MGTDTAAPKTTPPPAPSLAALYGPQGGLVAAPPAPPATIPDTTPDQTAKDTLANSAIVPNAAVRKDVASRVRVAVTGDVEHRNLPERVAEEQGAREAQGQNFQEARLATIQHLQNQRIKKPGEVRSLDPKVQAHDAAIDRQIDLLQDPGELNMGSDLESAPVTPENITSMPVLHGALKFLGGLTSPANAGMASGAGTAVDAGEAAAQVPEIAHKAAGFAFAAQMLHGAGQGVAEA